MTTIPALLLLFAWLASLIGGLLLCRDNRRLRAELRRERMIVDAMGDFAGWDVGRVRRLAAETIEDCNCKICAANRRVAN